MSFWDFFWLLVWSYVFFAYLMVMFRIITDLFRDPEVGGGMKALWLIALLVFPFLTALVYLITRGRGMAERQLAAMRETQGRTDEYIKSVAGPGNPSEQIASAKALLDDGTISRTEFDRLKAKALA
jgi:hypothetical protein